VTWFILLSVLLAGYAVLDGFDFGVGMLHLFARGDRERRIFMNSIGPIWDGNEVWLVTFGGALFAAFPMAYATVFSGFYTAFMLLLFGLIFRAVSIEFRSKVHKQGWRTAWDYAFFGSSLLASLLFGVAIGNAMIGVPLDERFVYQGGIFHLLRPFPLMVGLAVIVTFVMHGALYLYLKVPDDALRERVRDWMWHAWGLFLVFYILGTIYTLLYIPRAVENMRKFPEASIVVLVSVLAIANIPRAIYLRKPFQAFFSSAVTLLCLVALVSLVLWPNLVTASNDPNHSLTIYRAASSPGTLWIMFIIACIGMPFVLTYTAAIYWTFRGEVELGEHSY
jgi:cytochrome d ubiquinol oxidase subunit II